MTAHVLNKDVFAKDPTKLHLANQGVAKLQAPTPPSRRGTLRSELENFVCHGRYADGIARILESFLADVGKGTAPAAWISGFYGSGKSHLAAMLAALWENVEFEDKAKAEGLVHDMPQHVKAALLELRTAGKRHGGLLAAGGAMPGESADPGSVVLGFLFRAVGLPENVRSARIAFWLADLGVLDEVKTALAERFDTALEHATLSPDLSEAILTAKPDVATDAKELRTEIKRIFGDRAPIDPDDVEKLARKALTIGGREMPLTLLVLDEVQQFLSADPGQTLKIQTIVEKLSSGFDGKLLVVATGQQALSDLDNLQKLLGRFKVTVALADNDIDTVIRRTILRKDPAREPEVRAMLDMHSGEISRHLQGGPFAHSSRDEADAVADWPLLPSRRRVWKEVLSELDQSGLKGNLRGQLHTTLAAAQRYADKPLGHAVAADFLYERVGDDAFNLQMISRETRDRIEQLRHGSGDAPTKARLLMLIYMISRLSETAERHGVRTKAETLADLMIEDLAGEPELRAKIPQLLDELAEEGAVAEMEGGEWRLQTKESAQWETAFRDEKRRLSNDPSAAARLRSEGLTEALDKALVGAASIAQGLSKTPRRIHRLRPDEPTPKDGIPLRIFSGYTDSLPEVETQIKGSPADDPALYLLIPAHEPKGLVEALETRLAAEAVLAARGHGGTDAAGEARSAMEARRRKAEADSKSILRDAVSKARLLQAGGGHIQGTTAEAVKTAAAASAARLYPQFDDGDHATWGTVLAQANRKQPDALKAVNHSGEPEDHPVAKAILAQTTGSGKTGRELRAHFESSPFGWPQDAIDAMLVVLTNSGRLKARGEDGNAADPASIPRQKLSSVRFQTESIVATAAQKLAVRALLQKAGVPFETNMEVAALGTLIDTLADAASKAGGEPPAPASEEDPDLAAIRTLSGAEKLVAFAGTKDAWLEKLESWRSTAERINGRLPGWRLAERLVLLGAAELEAPLEAVRSNRALLAEPDPVAPIRQAAADSLRGKLNTAWAAWKTAWAAGEARLSEDPLWAKLAPDQRLRIRNSAGLRPAEEPAVDAPELIAESLETRSLETWDSVTKALPTRIGEALAEAAAELEPEARQVKLSGGLIKTTDELDAWLAAARERITAGLADGPVIPTI